MRRSIRGVLIAAGVLPLSLAAVLAVNAWRIAPGAPSTLPADAISFQVEPAAARLAQAVTFRTIAKAPGEPVDPQAFLALHAFLARSFPRVHGELRRETIGDYSLLYRWGGDDPALEPILLMGHMDVVPTLGKWTHPPFAATIASGFVWGRGTLDDKVSVLGILEAVEHLLARGVRPRRTVYLAFGHDEEIDGRNGAARIVARLKEQGVRLKYVLDEGSPIVTGVVPGIAQPVALIGTAEKGYLSLELIARTTGGHSSMPSRNSAVQVLGEAFDRLRANPPALEFRPPMSQTLDHLAPHFPFLARVLVANRWLFGPLLLSELGKVPESKSMITTTMALTLVHAGQKDNVLPDEARAVINFRLLPGETAAAFTAKVRTIVGDPAIEVAQYGAAVDPSPVANVDSEAFRQLAATVRQIFPDAIVAPALVIAATDARHYATVADQVFRFLPTRLAEQDLARMHGVDERVSIANYGEIIRFYIQLILNTAR